MLDLCRLIFGIASDLLRSQVALEAEILVLRQQINVLRRANPKRLRFVSVDRLLLGGVCRLFPKMDGALAIVRPETVIRWHRAEVQVNETKSLAYELFQQPLLNRKHVQPVT